MYNSVILITCILIPYILILLVYEHQIIKKMCFPMIEIKPSYFV